MQNPNVFIFRGIQKGGFFERRLRADFHIKIYIKVVYVSHVELWKQITKLIILLIQLCSVNWLIWFTNQSPAHYGPVLTINKPLTTTFASINSYFAAYQ